jgi:chromosome segregation ATPase
VIEQSLYFALGFLAAALLSLAILPAFWRRAYRLSRREIEATLPLSPKEIAAERDQLRAKFAIERVQLEQQVEAVKAAKQRDMRDKGSKSVAIAELEDTLSARREDISRLETRVAGLETTLSDTDADRATVRQALSVREAELATLQGVYGQLQQSHGTTSDIAAQRSIEIAAHKTNMEAQLMRIEEIDRIAKNARIELKARTDEGRATERSLREAEKDRAILTRKLESAEDIAERRAAAIAERDAKLDVLQEKAITFAKAGKELEAALKQEARKTATIEAQLQERDQTITRLREDARQTASDLSKSIEKLRSDRQKLQADLSETRAKAAVLQRELNGLKRASGGSDLRAAGSGGRIAKQGS